MKRRVLTRKLEEAGFVLLRRGNSHDVYARGRDREEVPRHREINEVLAKRILKRWGLE